MYNPTLEKIKRLVPFKLAKKLRGGYQKLNGLFYKGSEYFCPNCDHYFRKFLKCGENIPHLDHLQIVGGGIRKQCLCPRCFSKDRERLIYLYLRDKTELFYTPSKLLHIAPRGSLKDIFKDNRFIEYFPGDKFEKGYYYSKDVIKLDARKLDYDDNFFDVIICIHVMEHIKEDKLALKELYRVLKPGGFAILQVPISLKLEETYEIEVNSDKERIQHFGQYDHHRVYARDFKNKLEEVGFNVKLFNPTDDDWKIDYLKYGLNPIEDLYVSFK